MKKNSFRLEPIIQGDPVATPIFLIQALNSAHHLSWTIHDSYTKSIQQIGWLEQKTIRAIKDLLGDDPTNMDWIVNVFDRLSDILIKGEEPIIEDLTEQQVCTLQNIYALISEDRLASSPTVRRSFTFGY